MVAETSTQATSTEARLARLEEDLSALKSKTAEDASDNSVSIVCFSGEWDKLFAAFTIANGALALGQEVHMFFTFWGATALRNAEAAATKRNSILQRLIGWVLPRHVGQAPLSKMNAGGLGKVMLGKLMRDNGVGSLQELVDQARGLGARFHCCETSLRLFGWGNGDLIEAAQSQWCGVSTFLSLAYKSRVTLFI
jgi:peroxiredoxin family protein